MARPTSPVELGGKGSAEHRELAVRWTAPWRSSERPTTPNPEATIEHTPGDDPRDSSPALAENDRLGVVAEPMS